LYLVATLAYMAPMPDRPLRTATRIAKAGITSNIAWQNSTERIADE